MTKSADDLSDELINHFQTIGEYSVEISALADELTQLRKSSGAHCFNDKAILIKHLELTKLQYNSALISYPKYVHFTYHMITGYFEDQWLNGAINDRFEPISNKMDEIRKSHGLSDDEGWSGGDGPDDYNVLVEKYDIIFDEWHYSFLLEFGANDIADLFQNSRDELEELNEAGRKAVYVKDAESRLDLIIKLYEEEAEKTSSVGAYFSAIAMLCAAIEAKLIIKCIQNPLESRVACDQMGLTGVKLKSRNPIEWKLEWLIDICGNAGWLSSFETPDFVIFTQGLAHKIRAARNLLHPSLHVKRKEDFAISESQFQNWQYIYDAISKQLENIKSAKD